MKRKSYVVWRQSNEKPSIIPGCTGIWTEGDTSVCIFNVFFQMSNLVVLTAPTNQLFHVSMSLLLCLAWYIAYVCMYMQSTVHRVPCALIMMYNWIQNSAQLLLFCDNAVSSSLALSYCCFVQCQQRAACCMLCNKVFLSVMLATSAAKEEIEKTESAASCLCIGLHGAY